VKLLATMAFRRVFTAVSFVETSSHYLCHAFKNDTPGW